MRRTRLRLLFVLLAAVLGSMLAVPTLQAFPSIFREGVTIRQPGVTPGLVFFRGIDGIIRVLTLNGQVVREWASPLKGLEFGYTRPLTNGNILAKAGGAEFDDMILEVDQSGEIVWSFSDPGTEFHHDQSQLSNGNTLILCSRDFTDPNISDLPITDDCLMEVTPAGEVVWDWQTADHFDEFEFDQDTLDKIRDHAGDWAHANSAAVIPETDHDDPRFRAGNVIISYRFINSVAIIDRDTDEIVWRTTDDLTIGQHDAEMLPPGLSGAGNILIFDNGFGGHYNNGGAEVARNFSRIVEIDPLDFSLPWDYEAQDSGTPNWWFYGSFVSSAQRLANGNTFICEGPNGRLFEIDAGGRIVWEYVSPFTAEDPVLEINSNRVYRAERLPLDWLQLS